MAQKLTHLMGIVGVSSAMPMAGAAIAIIGYTQINPRAIAHTIPNSSITLETKIAQARLSEIDRVYVQEAAQAGMAEVELAKLALETSEDENIKKYAQQMIQDHTPLNQELMQLSQQKGITLPTNLSPKYQALEAQLSELSGANFDLAYINEAGINGHMENLIIHTRQIQLGQDPDLQAFAAKTIPVVESHLQLLDLLFMSPTQQ
ncbi:DUF4142 domain-containing protein [Nodularia spumigena CS-584]|uniref:DUF4142 domain-containing protein n=1 Tax=Nodularia spumigena UHCC 0060 TaxID=3110300 RepID=A0ABU5UTC5_NODSP|nr:DUF4142 domain-containing protein [Nodularia spumigena]MDB9383693.1 DUF4142 domain-containing protein [Nodularia spumigena CS-584]MEA5609501.1 DUF4142 domain-containing protein [Nodularia spumigena UHCC 0060]